jgi:hypothetical protein
MHAKQQTSLQKNACDIDVCKPNAEYPAEYAFHVGRRFRQLVIVGQTEKINLSANQILKLRPRHSSRLG